MIFAFFSLLLVASTTAQDDCKVTADAAVVLDMSEDAKVVETMKRTTLEAAQVLEADESRVGIWQVTPSLPQRIMPLNPLNIEMLKRELSSISSDATASAINDARRALIQSNNTDGGSFAPKAMLFVTASAPSKEVLKAAELVRETGIVLLAISVDLEDKVVEDLFVLTGGGTSKVFKTTKDATDTAAKIKEWLCSVNEDFKGQNFCFLCW